MQKILTDGTSVKVDDRKPQNCQCGDRCPFLKAGIWKPWDIMDKCRVTWHCFLHNQKIDFLWNECLGKFDPQRTDLCLSLDPDETMKQFVGKPSSINLVRYPKLSSEYDFAGFE